MGNLLVFIEQVNKLHFWSLKSTKSQGSVFGSFNSEKIILLPHVNFFG